MIETINIVNKEVSRELGLDESLIKSINSFYWKEVKAVISSCEHTSIRMKNLGTLIVSRHKVNKRILALIREIRYLRTNPEKKNEDYRQEKLEELRMILKRRNDIATIYKSNSDRFNAKKALKKHMGQQAPDPAGDSQQDCQPQGYKEIGQGTPGDMQDLPIQ